EQRSAAGMRERDERRQFLRLAAETIVQPAPERRRARRDASTGQRVKRLAVVVHAGLHRANDADVVHHSGEVRQQRGEFRARLSALLELPQTWQHLRAGLAGVVVLELARKL